MAARKRTIQASQKKLQKENPPQPTIPQSMSSLSIKALLIGFDNVDDKQGIETMTMQESWPWSKTVQRIADDMELYASQETTFSLQDYFNQHGIDWDMLDTWMVNSPYFKRKYMISKEWIGARRELWAAKEQYNPAIMAKSFPIYSRDYRRLKEWEHELASKKPTEPTNITIKVERNSNEDSGQTDRRGVQSTVGDTDTSGEAGHEEDGSEEPKKHAA